MSPCKESHHRTIIRTMCYYESPPCLRPLVRLSSEPVFGVILPRRHDALSSKVILIIVWLSGVHRLLKQIVGLRTRGNDNLYMKSTQQLFQWMWRLPSGGQSWLLLLLTPSQPAGTSGQFLSYQKNPFPDSFRLLLIFFLFSFSLPFLFLLLLLFLFFRLWILLVIIRFFFLYIFSGFFSFACPYRTTKMPLWPLITLLCPSYIFFFLTPHIFATLLPFFIFSHILKGFPEISFVHRKIWKRPFRKVKMYCRKISHIVHKNRQFHADFKVKLYVCNKMPPPS